MPVPMTNKMSLQYQHVHDDVSPDSSTRGNNLVLNAKLNTVHIARATVHFLPDKAWPIIAKPFKNKQTVALILLVLFGVVPFITVGIVSTRIRNGAYPSFFQGLFGTKIISCGGVEGAPQNSTVSGIEALFVLDLTFGKYTFSQVKIIDVTWDVGLGRGLQLAAWWISYIVFSDSLLRMMERHPASFKTFQYLCLDGICLSSVWALLKDLTRTRTKRTRFMFFYMVLSCVYVLGLPTILGAMTGYTPKANAWVDVDNDRQIVPASTFVDGYLIYSGPDMTLNDTCVPQLPEPDKGYTDAINVTDYLVDRREHCDCKTNNGTLVPGVNYPLAHHQDPYNSCTFNYLGNLNTFQDRQGNTQNCSTIMVTIGDHVYDFNSIDFSNSFKCNPNTFKGYRDDKIASKTRCLPDTSKNPSYQWGFSSMLSGVFVIFQLVWSLSMYILWQDAQFHSELVKAGYSMTTLQAAFVLGETARSRTGLEDKVLIAMDKKSLERSLHGKDTGVFKRKESVAEVDVGVFGEVLRIKKDEEEFELRRRSPAGTT